MQTKRKGGFLVDVLLGMLILMIGIIPLVSSISFAYQALTSSVEKTFDLNEKVYDEIDNAMLACSLGGVFPVGFDFQSAAANISVTGGFGTSTPTPALWYKSLTFKLGNRAGEVKIYMVK